MDSDLHRLARDGDVAGLRRALGLCGGDEAKHRNGDDGEGGDCDGGNDGDNRGDSHRDRKRLVELRDELMATPLIVASQFRQAGAVQFLVEEAGADVDAKDAYGKRTEKKKDPLFSFLFLFLLSSLI